MGGKVLMISMATFLLLAVGLNVADATGLVDLQTVSAFCKLTPFEDICVKTIEPVAKRHKSDPKDYLIAILNATQAEIHSGMTVTMNTDSNLANDDEFHHEAVEDCKEMLSYAVEELQSALTTVGDFQMHSLSDRVDELLNWLSAVYSYQTYCIDEFENSEFQPNVKKGLLSATELTNNAINIIAQITDLMKGMNVGGLLKDMHASLTMGGKVSSGIGNGRLLDRDNPGGVDSDGLPSWMEQSDRKLLGRGGGGHRNRNGKVRGGGGHHKGPIGGGGGGGGAVTPDAVVAKDGSGKYKTITDALRAYAPAKKGVNTQYTIYVKAGVYDETVLVDKNQINVFIYGDGIGRTIITGKKNFALMNIQTSKTATFSALGDGFKARGITFRNTAGPEGHQAVALRLQSDRAVIWDCAMEGYQDTLYYQVHRQLFYNCEISGTVDFIFGKGSAVIQNSRIILRKGLPKQFNTVTADGQELRNSRTGLVLQNCTILGERGLPPNVLNYLGRPWKAYATTVIMQSDIPAIIDPAGYKIWDGESFHKTCKYLEYDNRGPGANTRGRNFREFSQSTEIGAMEAGRYTATSFIQGNTWMPATGAPFKAGL